MAKILFICTICTKIHVKKYCKNQKRGGLFIKNALKMQKVVTIF